MDFLVCPMRNTSYSYHRDHTFSRILLLEWHLLAMLENRGFSLPTADEWAYLCGGGCRTLFPWGDGLDYSMRLRWFEDMDEDENRPYDIEEPNFFGLSIEMCIRDRDW